MENRSEGIFVEVAGGGSVIRNPYFGEKGRIEIPPDKYNVYRKKINDPPRTGDPNLYDWWDVAPPLPEERHIIGTTNVEEFDGTPATALPPQSSYTEPGDVDDPEKPEETQFELIATVDNLKVVQRYDSGEGEFYDQDVVDGARYEYYATALIAQAESPDSNHEEITYNGPEHHHHRLGFLDNNSGIDITPPVDPTIPPDDYGEVEDYDVPFDDEEGDLQDLADDIGPRVFAKNEPGFRIQMDVLIPLLGLEYGQTVELPVIDWDVYANELHMEQETENDDWMLVGYKMEFERDKQGEWKSQRTQLTLQERMKN